MSYDSADRLTNIAFTGGKWLSFAYEAAGRRASSLDQLGHRLTYAYDAAGRLDSMTNELGQLVVRCEYEPAGRVGRKTLGNGLVTAYAYDAAGQLLTLTNRLAEGMAISWFNYAYDTRGRRTAMATHYGAWTYDYDDLGQLTRAVLNSTDPQVPSQDLTYSYDALGNRIRTIENGVTTEYNANNLNQYVRVGSTNYVFDADGNLIQEIAPSGTTTYSYNDENRLVGVTSPQGAWQYAYDALGNRVATTENGVAKRFVIDPIGLGNVVGEYEATGNLLAHYDHGLGLLSRRDAAGDPAYYTFDAIGNVQQLVSSAGALANAYAYAPFGTLLRRAETIPNPFQFVGQLGVMKEGNGLNCMRARFFDSEAARFLSSDPIRFPSSELNGYRYARNNPARFIDPLGLVTRQELESWGINPDAPSQAAGFRTEMEYYQYLEGFDSHSGAPANALQRDLGQFVFGALVNPKDVWIGAGIGGVVLGGIALLGGAELWGFLFWGYVTGGMSMGATLGAGWSFADAFSRFLPAAMGDTLGASGQAVGGFDPNRKTGPGGFSTNGFMSLNSVLAYRIDFENESNATAPAQIVQVTDRLSTNLDRSTFQLTAIGFGDHLITISPGSQYYETMLQMSYNGVDFEVWIIAGIDLSSGEVYAEFYSLDPETELPPNVLIGFLPPEDGTGRGMGCVSYTILAKSGLPTGTQIHNVAQIIFDQGQVVATNQRNPHNPAAGADPAKECLNTIDAGPPTSAVAALPPTVNSTNFTASWTGQDDAGGSGIAGYDIYASDNSGTFVLWKTNTTDTSATYTGQDGHTYGFYSVAHDGVGHTESKAAAAEAQTRVEITSNTAPDLPEIPDQSVFEGKQLRFTVSATDAEKPPQVLTFSLLGTVPAGAAIDPLSGLFTWMPSEAQGPSTNVITVGVVDNGEPPMGATNSFTVVVNETNSPPVLTVPPDQTIGATMTLTVTNLATDPDIPANVLTFGLVSAPTGVNLDSATGVLTWTPTEAQATTTNAITVKLSDDGKPSLSATNSFIVVVTNARPAPSLTVSQLDGLIGIAWPTAAVGFSLEVTETLEGQIQWAPVATSPVVVGDQNAITLQPTSSSGFYRLRKEKAGPLSTSP
jgi:RHS repeat-associated protein